MLGLRQFLQFLQRMEPLGLLEFLQFLQRMEPFGLRLLGQRLWAGHERFWLVQFL